MMPRTIALLLLTSLLTAACGDDEPDVADISEMRVVKVSGDQEAPVQAPETQASIVPTRIVLQAGGDLFTNGYSPEPLVARVVADGTGGAQSAITAPISAAVVPSGTLVHWKIEPDCGTLFASTTQTDDSAHTANRWAPGTKAGTCHAAAGRLVGTEIVIDATWELVVLPGPPLGLWNHPLQYKRLTAGEVVRLDTLGLAAHDQYGNVIPDSIFQTYQIDWEIAGPMENYSLDCLAWPVIQQGSGWSNFVVPPASEWPYCFRTYYQGQYLGGQIFRSQPAS